MYLHLTKLIYGGVFGGNEVEKRVEKYCYLLLIRIALGSCGVIITGLVMRCGREMRRKG